MESLFEAIRNACSPESWSRGVEVARRGDLLAEATSTDEIAVTVPTGSGLASCRVTLFPDDPDWECSCGSAAAGCFHAAAAVIAVRRARESGKSLPEPSRTTARVHYRFERRPDGLALERWLSRGGAGEERIETTLAGLVARAAPGRRLVASQSDLAIDVTLGPHRRGAVPRHLWPRLLRALEGRDGLRLAGRPVRVSAAPVLPAVRLEEREDGFFLRFAETAETAERFVNGVALVDGVLRPCPEPKLTGRERQELTHGRRFGPDEIAELVTEILPSLRRRVRLDIGTVELPETSREAPRIVLDTARRSEDLSVLATLVYGDPPRARVDGGRIVHLGGSLPIRDAAAERRLIRRLHHELGLAPGVRVSFVGGEAVGFVARIRGWEGSVRGTAHEHFRLLEPLTARVAVEGDRFDVAFESAGSSKAPRRHADPAVVLRAWRSGASVVPLLGGGYAPIPEDWLARFGDRVADLLAAKAAVGGIPAASRPDLKRLAEDLGDVPVPDAGPLASLAEGFSGIPSAELPLDLTAELRPYQKRGVDWLAFLGRAGLGALLADDMGLGKTVQALCAIRGRALIVAPTSVLHNWADEARRFRPGLRTSIYHGPGRRLDPEADLTLTTYAILRLDRETIERVAWDTVVLDEAQTIKNPESQVAAAAFAIRGRFRVALTGTPVENRLEELWSQFRFTNPGFLGAIDDFRERYARPVSEGDADAAGRLRERIRPLVLRRLKREVAAELPPRTDAVLWCELDEAERRVYDTIRAATREEVVRKLREGGSVLAALEALLRLRQACCHPALVPGQSAERSSKVERLLEALETLVADGHKALVFSQWTSLLDLVEPHLAAAGLPNLRLDGSTQDRAGVVARFQDDSGPPLLLVSLRAGGTGLNLTAADHVFLLDPWWNPAVEDQAADRTHRIGQEKPVLVYRLVAEGTVEERILALQEHKRGLADAALAGTGGAASLTREDLLALLD